MKLHGGKGGRFRVPHKKQKPQINHLPEWNKRQLSRPLPQSLSQAGKVVHNSEVDESWSRVQMALRNRDSWDVFESLLSIVKFVDDSNEISSYVDDSASHLRYLIDMELAIGSLAIINQNIDLVGSGVEKEGFNKDKFHPVLDEAVIFCGSGDRHSNVVKRMIQKSRNDQQSINTAAPGNSNGKPPLSCLSERELNMMEKFWDDFENQVLCRNTTEAFLILYQIVVTWDRKNCQWMPGVKEKIRSILQNDSKLDATTMKALLKCCEKENNRHTKLMKKLLTKLDQNEFDRFDHSNSWSRKPKFRKIDVLPLHYDKILQSLRDNHLENSNIPSWDLLKRSYLLSKLENHHLSLQQPPTWINNTTGISSLLTTLNKIHNSKSSVPIQLDNMVAFDSEWYSTTGSDTNLSTIQFGILQGDGVPHAWVVDLQQHSNSSAHKKNDGTTSLATGSISKAVADEDFLSEEHSKYPTATRQMLKWLFLESDINLIGFACYHDLRMISSYIGEEISVSSTRFVDMQLLAAKEMMAAECDDDNDDSYEFSPSSLPGLKSCCSYFQVQTTCNNPKQLQGTQEPWTLSKAEQCSDWSRRPLSADQLEYAGLDAVVLLVLLAEMIR